MVICFVLAILRLICQPYLLLRSYKYSNVCNCFKKLFIVCLFVGWFAFLMFARARACFILSLETYAAVWINEMVGVGAVSSVVLLKYLPRSHCPQLCTDTSLGESGRC